jgi:hypothetical protein
MLNHSFEANAFAFYDSLKKCYVLKAAEKVEQNEDDANELKNNYLIKKNKQIYITYGCHDNKTLLIEYGFVLDNNAYDKISLKKRDFKELIKNLEEKTQNYLWLEADKQSILTDLSFNGHDGPSWCLLKFFDLIIQLINKEANKGSKQIKKIRRSSSEQFTNTNEIKLMFVNILNAMKCSFSAAVQNLNELKQLEVKSNYKNDMVLKYLKLQLEIVNFNLELTNNPEEWSFLF